MNSETHQGLDRRGLLQSLAVLLGGAAATGLPSLTWAADAAPKFFSPAEFAILSETVETMIPRTDTLGARDAGVPAAMDGLMRPGRRRKRRRNFARSLRISTRRRRPKRARALSPCRQSAGFRSCAPTMQS